jgi:hypothetical protein
MSVYLEVEKVLSAAVDMQTWFSASALLPGVINGASAGIAKRLRSITYRPQCNCSCQCRLPLSHQLGIANRRQEVNSSPYAGLRDAPEKRRKRDLCLCFCVDHE